MLLIFFPIVVVVVVVVNVVFVVNVDVVVLFIVTDHIRFSFLVNKCLSGAPKRYS